MHAHGTVAHDPSLPRDEGPKISDEWKKKIDANRTRKEEKAEEDYSIEEFQMDLAEIIDEDEKEKARNSLFDQVESAPTGTKRQRPSEIANVEVITRKGLRATLLAKASELKSLQERGLEVQSHQPATDNKKSKKDEN